MKNFSIGALLFVVLFLSTHFSEARYQVCKPSGDIIGKKPPPGQCNQENDSDCCKQGGSLTQSTNVHLRCREALRQFSPLIVSRRVEMEAHHQNVTTSTTQITHRLLHYQLDGTVEGQGALTISQ
ncbi:Ripening-related protein 1-like [Forsythia ovata]|uniref:Ripening-related protein 1-like n=1 Tax=Forsythia ovata TaxID=205694 RepID=A0ABD1QNC5_9LAMI